MKPYYLEFLTIPESWIELLKLCLEEGRVYRIDRGSRVGSKRKELDLVVVQIKKPWLRPLTAYLDVPNFAPSEREIYQYYLEFIRLCESKHDYDYTYAERINEYNQLEKVIQVLAATPHTNQAVIRITKPSDIELDDPPCMCLLQFKIIEDRLVCYSYFRSWDLFGGYPRNVPAIQLLKEEVLSSVNEIREVKGLSTFIDGELVLISSGLHIYESEWDIVKQILNNTIYKRLR